MSTPTVRSPIDRKNALLMLLDITIAGLAIFVTFDLFFANDPTVTSDPLDLITILGLKTLVLLILGWVTRVYRIDWRYGSMRELQLLAIVLVMSDTFVLFASYVLLDGFSYQAIFIQSLLAFNGMLFIRLVARTRSFFRFHAPVSNGKATLVIGGGESGQKIIKELKEHRTNVLHVVGVLDDNPLLHRLYIHGTPVIGSIDLLERKIEELNIEVVVLAIPSLPYGDRVQLLKRIEKTGVESHALPMLAELASGKVSLNEIREVAIEDLLGREPVQLDVSEISQTLSGLTIFISGAGGSIGSELCRQLMKFNPGKLILFGHGESSIYAIDRELRLLGSDTEICPVIGDVQDRARVMEVFDQYRPDVVYHAAAHKHVPLMEDNPREAVKNNIYGTKNMVEAADFFEVKRFVMISTDKAVNPTNVMGATKRVAEMIVQQQARHSETTFSVVRFGNVLGSRGSVVPLFKEQIQRGGPITVTHPEMTRYFMTIPEASRLVIQASVRANGGEVFVLDMGNPVKIVDLAKRMITLSGFTLEQIPIHFSGIRPGEKLFEELLATSEHTNQVYEKIFVGCTRPFKSVDPILITIEYLLDQSNGLTSFLLFVANNELPEEVMESIFAPQIEPVRMRVNESTQRRKSL